MGIWHIPTFPDDNFREYVSRQEIDTDQDGYLSYEEMISVTNIEVEDMSIFTLKGIEYFYSLKNLDISNGKPTHNGVYLSNGRKYVISK